MPGKIFFCVLCFVVLSSLSLTAQNGNPCGVKAIISPGGDSTLTAPTAVRFESTSINATDYKFIFDYISYPLNTPVYTGFGPGLTTIKLVAYNGNCTDTAVVYYFYAGQLPVETDNPRRLYGFANRGHEVTDLIDVSAGGHILAGHRLSAPFSWQDPQQGVLIKTKQEGCVEWARKLVGSASADITMIEESSDGGFFVLADVDFRYFVAKLDANGNVQWAEKLAGKDDIGLIVKGMEALPDGGVAIIGHYLSDPKPVLLRLDNNGGIKWQKEYDYNFISEGALNNLLLKDNYLYAGGSAGYNSYSNYDAFLTKIDLLNGQTIWTKKYTCPNGTIGLGDIIDIDSTLLVNILTGSGITNVPTIGGIMRLDTSGNVLAASLVAETYIPNNLVGPYSVGSTHLIRSGKSFYLLSAGAHSLSLQPGISYATKLIRFDSTFQVKWVQLTGGAGVPRFFHNAAAPKDGLAIAGNEWGSGHSPHSLSILLSLKLIDSAGGNPNADCFFGNQLYRMVPLTITSQSIQWITNQPAAYVPANSLLPLYPFYPELRFKCPDYVDSCSYLKLTGPSSVCNLNDTYTYNVHKNKGCGQPTQWLIPFGVETVSQSNHSVTVRFSTFDRYVIYGSNPLSCTPVQDSIVIVAESKSPSLNLGPDQQICPQNSITLQAGPAFLSYKWQDGNTDSLLRTDQPGKYWVTVTDSCNNMLSDTVIISLAPPIPFSVGPDRTKCNNDTIHLQAPLGFINYTWSPAYNINDKYGKEVIINPLLDTVYTVIAEKTPSCFAYDTVKISVAHSPAIDIGKDTIICMGNSVLLDAGAGFQQYQWNNGSSAQMLSVDKNGKYFVAGTTGQGCTSSDTINIVVLNNPVVHLGSDNTLCTGGVRILNAGNFAAYLWQNGQTGSTFKVTQLGKYYVRVTDNHHCIGSDTLNITRLLPIPSKFLPPDTALCSYGRMELGAVRSFSQYVWSNGAISPIITINKPGLYWLQATDENLCTGKDTVMVRSKDCLQGIYVPSAFSPNSDGKNDLFKPLLFGNIKQYQFTIYNRWGQLLFNSTEPGKGWDGRRGEHMQNNNVFIWVCRYQLEGEEVKTVKGTVTLIK